MIVHERLELQRCAQDVLNDADWGTDFYECQSAVPDITLLTLDVAVTLNANDGDVQSVDLPTVAALRKCLAEVPEDWGWDKYITELGAALDWGWPVEPEGEDSQ